MFKNIRVRRFGFTLAEVLIVVGIIGIIAESTIPVLVNNVNDSVLSTSWKKIYSELTQATQQIATENGGTLDGAFGAILNGDNYRDVYMSYLKNIKKCDMALGSICWANTANLNTPDNHTWACNWNNARSTAILPNGAILCFVHTATDCSSINAGNTTACGTIYIDVNGLKAPNTWGKDVFCGYPNINGHFTPCGAPGTYASFPSSFQGCNTTDASAGPACSFENLYK